LLDPFGKKRIKEIKITIEQAKAGDAEGQFYLGMWHLCGYNPGDIEPIPEDKTEAMKWIRKAAEQGHEYAKEWLKKNAKDKSE